MRPFPYRLVIRRPGPARLRVFRPFGQLVWGPLGAVGVALLHAPARLQLASHASNKPPLPLSPSGHMNPFQRTSPI
jgi:hypothetical protein